MFQTTSESLYNFANRWPMAKHRHQMGNHRTLASMAWRITIKLNPTAPTTIMAQLQKTSKEWIDPAWKLANFHLDPHRFVFEDKGYTGYTISMIWYLLQAIHRNWYWYSQDFPKNIKIQFQELENRLHAVGNSRHCHAQRITFRKIWDPSPYFFIRFGLLLEQLWHGVVLSRIGRCFLRPTSTLLFWWRTGATVTLVRLPTRSMDYGVCDSLRGLRQNVRYDVHKSCIYSWCL